MLICVSKINWLLSTTSSTSTSSFMHQGGGRVSSLEASTSTRTWPEWNGNSCFNHNQLEVSSRPNFLEEGRRGGSIDHIINEVEAAGPVYRKVLGKLLVLFSPPSPAPTQALSSGKSLVSARADDLLIVSRTWQSLPVFLGASSWVDWPWKSGLF